MKPSPLFIPLPSPAGRSLQKKRTTLLEKIAWTFIISLLTILSALIGVSAGLYYESYFGKEHLWLVGIGVGLICYGSLMWLSSFVADLLFEEL